MIKLGEQAPDFSLVSQTGQEIRLKDYRHQWVALFFYPKDFTPGCTQEVCHFRDQLSRFQASHIQPIGISSDTLASHQAFASDYQLPFPILSDPKGQIRKLYGVPKTLWLFPGRVTYLLDPDGIVRHMVSASFNPKAHSEEILQRHSEITSRSGGGPA